MFNHHGHEKDKRTAMFSQMNSNASEASSMKHIIESFFSLYVRSDSRMTNGHAGSLQSAQAGFVNDSLEESLAGKEAPANEERAPLASNAERCTPALEATDPVIDQIGEDELKKNAEKGETTPSDLEENSVQPILITEEVNVKLTDNEPTSDLEQVSDSSEELPPTFTSNDENQVLTSDDENIPSQTEAAPHVNDISFEMASAPAVDAAPVDTPQEKATPIVNGFHHEIESVPIESEGRSSTPNLDKKDEITTVDIELPVENAIPSISWAKVEGSEAPTPADASKQDTVPPVTTAVPLAQTILPAVHADPVDIASTHQNEPSQLVAVKVAEPSNTVQDKPNGAVQPYSTSTSTESSSSLHENLQSSIAVDNHVLLPNASTAQNNHPVPQADPSKHVVLPSPAPFDDKVHQPEPETPIAHGSRRIKENHHSAIPNKPSSRTPKQAVQPEASATRTVPPSTVTSNEVRKVTNSAKQAYSTVLKKSGPTTTPVQRATEEKSQVLPLPAASEPKTPRVSMEQRVQTVHVVTEPPIAPVAPVEEVKKSSTRNKKSRRANARIQPTKTSNVKPMTVPKTVVSDEDEEEQPLPAPPVIVLQTPVEQLSTAPKTPEATPE